ncbi:hypothetical protein KAZ66_04440, partial [Candidatus Woesebacteria bacterium]|nr:hypothetical protein [Candidatus Woesebacteria bacterium]
VICRCHKVERDEIELKFLTRVVLNRGEFFEDCLDTFFDQRVVRVDLVLDQIGKFDEWSFVFRKVFFGTCTGTRRGLGFTHSYINAKMAGRSRRMAY